MKTALFAAFLIFSNMALGGQDSVEFPPEDSGVIHWASKKTGIAVNREDVIQRSDRAKAALGEVLSGMDGFAVKWMVRKADCVIYLNLYRASVAAGARMGRGLGSCRVSPGSNEWSAPFFVRTAAISAGPQLGLDQSDYFLFFPSKEVFTNILSGNITLEGNAAITVAAWGRSVSAGTDVELLNLEIKKDFIYSYAVSRGAYVGASFEGGMFLPSDTYNYFVYKDRPMEKVLSTPVRKTPDPIRGFPELLNLVVQENEEKDQ